MSSLSEGLLVSAPLNCPGMYRGVIRGDGVPKVAIFKEEELEEVEADAGGIRRKEWKK